MQALPSGNHVKTGIHKLQKIAKGKFEINSKRCEPCAVGTLADEKGSQFCQICHPGTFSSDGAESCSPWPAGMFGDGIASTDCKKCPSETNSLGVRPAACKDPDRGCTFRTFENADSEYRSCVPGRDLTRQPSSVFFEPPMKSVKEV